MFKGSNCDRKSQLSGILTEPLNPRAPGQPHTGLIRHAGTSENSSYTGSDHATTYWVH